MRCIILICAALYIASCTSSDLTSSDKITLSFSIEQDQDIYKQSIYGEPPQFAIWLENKETGKIRTVSVTRRTASGKFEGKAKVPVALPAWIGAFRKETGRDDIPTPKKPVDNYDAISRPTPKTSDFSARIRVPKESAWYYYVEVNVAGDYSTEFPLYQPNGVRDLQGNGQPSIIYRGDILAKLGNESSPELIGRTEQLYMSTEINPDIEGIKSAKKIFRRIKVSCQ